MGKGKNREGKGTLVKTDIPKPLNQACPLEVASIIIIIAIIIMDVAPFTTDPFATGPFTTRLVVKGSVIIIIIIIIMIVIIVFGICVRFFLSISWSGVIMMVVYEEVDSETDMVAD